MKVKIITLVLVLSYLHPSNSRAQGEPQPLSAFPPSVITRIYEVSSKVTLSAAQQQALAKHYRIEDSLLSALIIQGAPQADIEKMQHTLHARFLHILTPATANAYYTKYFEPQARKEGVALARQVQEQYDMDSAATNKLAELYFRRQLNADKAYYTDTPDSALLDTRLKRIMAHYDSLINRSIGFAAAKTFITKKIARLNDIKPLSANLQNNLLNTFYLQSQKNDNGFAENFTVALHKAITDTAYYAGLYHTEIEQSAALNASHYLKKTGQKQKLTKAAVPQVAALIYSREWTKAVLNKAYANKPFFKDSILNQIGSYYDSLINLVLIDDGSDMGNNQFALALKSKQRLQLQQSQVDSLLFYGTQIKYMKDTFNQHHVLSKLDTKAFEAHHMKQIVSDSQYTLILYIKNKPTADTSAQNDWREMTVRNLAGKYNKDTVIHALTAYYLAKWGAYYRYSDDSIKRKANVKYIEQHAPAALKELNAANKNDNPITGDAAGSYQY